MATSAVESSRPDIGLMIAPTPRAIWHGPSLVRVVQGLILVLLTANLGRIPVISAGETSAPLLVNDMAVALLAMIGLAVAAMTRSLRVDRVALIGALFAAVGAASAFVTARSYGFSTFELTVSLAYLVRWMVYFAVYVVLINVVRRRHVDAVWTAVETMLLIFAAFGIVQAAFLPGFAQMVYPDSRAYLDWDIQGYRLVSTVLEPNIAAAMLLIGLLVQLARISVGVRVPRWRPITLFVALVLTLSRSGALGFVAGVATILLVRGLSKRLLRWTVLVFILVALALPKLIPFAAGYGKFSTGGSAAARIASWIELIRVFREHPVFGVGFNTFGFVHERSGFERFGIAAYSSDGGLMFIAVLTGVVGLTIYLWMLWTIFRRCRTIWRETTIAPEHRGLAIGMAAVIVALCVHSLFVNSLLTTFVMELFWILCALTFAIAAGEAAVEREPIVTRTDPRLVVSTALGDGKP